MVELELKQDQTARGAMKYVVSRTQFHILFFLMLSLLCLFSKKSLCPCALDECSLSIGKVNTVSQGS